MAQLNLNTSVVNDKEITMLIDTALPSINELKTFEQYPFVKVENGTEWDEVIETLEDAEDNVAYVADEELGAQSQIGKGFRAVITNEEFAGSVKLTRREQKSFSSLKTSIQKEKIMKIISDQTASLITGMSKFIDREVNAFVTDFLYGTYTKDISGTKKVIDTDCPYKSGKTYSNKIVIGGVSNPAFSQSVLDHYKKEGAFTKNSLGEDVFYNPDTIVVAAGTSAALAVDTVVNYSNITPTTHGENSVYQNGVGGWTVIEVPGLGYSRAANGKGQGARKTERDTMYFVYDSNFNDKPVAKVNFAHSVESKETTERNGTKLWDAFGDIGIGVVSPAVGLQGSLGTGA